MFAHPSTGPHRLAPHRLAPPARTRSARTRALLCVAPLLGAAGVVATAPASAAATNTVVVAATAGPALSVDVSANRHPISPDIYGMNSADEALADRSEPARTTVGRQRHNAVRLRDRHHQPGLGLVLRKRAGHRRSDPVAQWFGDRSLRRPGPAHRHPVDPVGAADRLEAQGRLLVRVQRGQVRSTAADRLPMACPTVATGSPRTVPHHRQRSARHRDRDRTGLRHSLARTPHVHLRHGRQWAAWPTTTSTTSPTSGTPRTGPCIRSAPPTTKCATRRT